MSKKQPSLEAILKKLSTQPVRNDPKRRSRIELLAIRMWKRALDGDKDSQRMLLDRLPAALPDPDPQSAVAVGAGSKGDPYTQLVDIIKALVGANILPPDAFSSFVPPEQAEALKTEQ